MKATRIAPVAAALTLLVPGLALAQAPKPATYITDEQVKAVNAGPGVDRQLVSVDIGKLNLAVGIIHRGSSNAPARRPLRRPLRRPPPGGGRAAKPVPRLRPRARPAASSTITRPRPTSSSRAPARWSPAATSSTGGSRRPTAR